VLLPEQQATLHAELLLFHYEERVAQGLTTATTLPVSDDNNIVEPMPTDLRQLGTTVLEATVAADMDEDLGGQAPHISTELLLPSVCA
jgi:hypothetical protein